VVLEVALHERQQGVDRLVGDGGAPLERDFEAPNRATGDGDGELVDLGGEHVAGRERDVGELLGQEGRRPRRVRRLTRRGVVAAAQEQGGDGDEGSREPALDPGHHAWR
jgi:hypothetical protein